MSPVNWVNPLSPSAMVDKVKNVQQTKGDVSQFHAETYTVRQENVRQKRVTDTRDGEKVRMRRESEKEKKKKGRKDKMYLKKRGFTKGKNKEKREESRRIDLTV